MTICKSNGKFTFFYSYQILSDRKIKVQQSILLYTPGSAFFVTQVPSMRREQAVGAVSPGRDSDERPVAEGEPLSCANEAVGVSPVCVPAGGVHAVSDLSYGVVSAVRADGAPQAEPGDEGGG